MPSHKKVPDNVNENKFHDCANGQLSFRLTCLVNVEFAKLKFQAGLQKDLEQSNVKMFASLDFCQCPLVLLPSTHLRQHALAGSYEQY